MTSEFHIPFRCPNCGDSRKFETLHDLRRHLENEHSYMSSRHRHRPMTSSPAVGGRPRIGRHSPLMELFHSDAQRLEESLRKNKEDELNNKKLRGESSDTLLHNNSASNLSLREKIQNVSTHPSFRDHGHSSRLQKYYPPPKNIRDRHNLGGLQTNSTFHVQSNLNEKSLAEPDSEISGLLAGIHMDEIIQTSSTSPNILLHSRMPSSGHINPSEKHIQETLSALSHEVLVERASQYATADSLYTAQELLSSVEQAAEVKIAQQKKVIELLAEKLKEKENRLTGVMHQIENLTHHQIDSMEKVSALKQQSDLKAELLQRQLDQKQKDFDTLNKKLFEIQQSLVKGNSSLLKSGKNGDDTHANVNLSTESAQLSTSFNLVPEHEKPTNGTEKLTFVTSATKDKEIKKVKNKAQQLERDRQNLLIEMQNLLESAAADNEKLQSELASQNHELSQLSFDLEQSKQEQEELLGETHALYRQADVSLAKLKLMLKDREEELKNVNKSLEHAKATQAKLARERDEYVRLCQDRETKYLEMMSSNTEQVKTMKKTLDSSLQEKKKLEEKLKELKQELAAKNGKDTILSENVACLKSALEDKMRSQSRMKEELQKREDKLKKAKREMERMTKFLEDTAEKELEARSKLEDFISGLIDRAGKAEADLHKLKESYRLQQTSRESLKKNKRESKELDLSSLPGASSMINKQSSEYDTRSLSSSIIHNIHDDKIHYHSPPKGAAIQQSAHASVPRKYSQKNPEMPYRPQRDKSMQFVDEVDSDVHNYSGDGNASDLSELSPNLQHDKPLNHNGTSAMPDSSYQHYDTDKMQLKEKKVVVPASSIISEEPRPNSVVSDLHLCSACSQMLHAAHSSVCPMQGFKSQQPSNVTFTNHSNTLLNVSPIHQLPSHPVLPDSKSLHVVPHSTVTKSMPQPASLALLQYQPNDVNLTVNPLALSPVNLHGSSLPHYKGNTSTDVRDKILFAPGTHFPHFAPVYFNSSPQFYNSISADPYNLYTDWSKQLKLSLPAYKDDDMDDNLYSTYLKSKELSVFKNIPEVEKMFANVFKHSPYSHNFDTPPLTEESHKSYTERQYPKQEGKLSQKLPLDENGIMWESQSRDPSKHHRGKHYTQDNLLKNDDTDIDEDLSDFIYDTEPATHANQDSSEYFIAKKKYPTTVTRAPRHYNEFPPLGAKIAKVLASDDAKKYTSSARDHYNKYLVPNTLKMQQTSSNEYSSEESTEDSPLDQARMVQKRLEHFTSANPRNVLISKQSEGFDVSQMDSDFSTSSYQSLCKPSNNKVNFAEKLPATEEIKETTNKKSPSSFSEKFHTVEMVSSQKLPETKKKQKHPLTESEKDQVYEVMEKESVARKPNYLAMNPGEKAGEKYIHEFPKTVQQHSTVQREAQPLIFQGDAYNETKSMQDSSKSLNPPSTKQTEDFAELPLSTQKERPIQSVDVEKPHTVTQPVSTTQIDIVPNLVLTVKEEHSIQKDVGQDLNKSNPQDTQHLEHAIQKDIGQDLNESNLQDIQHLEHARGTSFDGLEENEDVSETSSDEDFVHQAKDLTKAAARKESIDASTDTDLEKLAKPGYVQKGLVVRKNIPTVKRIRKNKRRKPALIRATSEESSGADDLDEGSKERRRFIRRMRVALFRIFSYLDTGTLLKISRVSKEWCKVSRHPALWKVVTLENKAISSNFLITLSKWCLQTQSLTLQELTGRSIHENESAEEYTSSIRGSLEAGLEKFLSSCQNSITQLHIEDCDNILTDKCLWIVSGYCRLLTKLTYRSAVDCVSPQLMWALGGGCPGVTSLFVQPKEPFKVNGMNNRCLLLIGQFYKDIQEIGLAGKEFDSAGLLSLVQSCQRLRVIHMEHCLTITSDLATNLCKVGLKNLHSLSIHGTTVEAKALQTFQGNSRQLKKILVKINIENCVVDPSKKKEKENYKKMVKALEGLKSKAGFGNIFTLEAGPAE